MTRRLEQLVEQLPPDMVQEVEDFAEFLLEKRAAGSRGKLEFRWAGALEDLRDEYSTPDEIV
ncbi:MAG: DUF2281 domain-containing protein [Anaerolineae bacterium]